MIAVRLPFLPLDKTNLTDNQDDNKDEDHLRVHLCMTRVLLMHPKMFVVPFLLRRELVPLDAVPVYGDVLVVVSVSMTKSCHQMSEIFYKSYHILAATIIRQLEYHII